MNYEWSSYCKEKISKFFASTISAFVFMYFAKKAPSPWEKRGKRFRMRKLFKNREEKALLQY